MNPPKRLLFENSSDLTSPLSNNPETPEYTALRPEQSAQRGVNEAEIYKRGQSFLITSPAEDHRVLKVKRIY